MPDAAQPHDHAGAPVEGCPQCLVKPSMARSAKFAWAVAAVMAMILAGVFVLGMQRQWGIFAAGGGLVLFMVLACPLMMGGMMWMMMRMGSHH